MSLAWPFALLILLVPGGILAYRRFRKPKRKPAFVAEAATLAKLPGYAKANKRAVRMRRIERVLLSALLIVVALVIARPQSIITSYDQEKSRDTVLCLDVSGSMKDYIPLAIKTLEDIYKKNPSDRYSIVVFGSRAVTLLPLTRDQVAIQQKIDLLREVYEKDNDPNYQFRSLPGFGTDVGEGVLASVQRFDDLKTYKTRNIVLVSDLDQTGGDFDPDSTKYLEKIGLVPKNRVNMYILQPAPEFIYATTPQQIVAVSGGQVYRVDKNNAKESAQNLLNQIFAQIVNSRSVVRNNHADYPYIVMAGMIAAAVLWSAAIAIRWRRT